MMEEIFFFSFFLPDDHRLRDRDRDTHVGSISSLPLGVCVCVCVSVESAAVENIQQSSILSRGINSI